MRKTNFLKHIRALSEEELREELDQLYTKLEEVRKYYVMELGTTKDRNKKYEKAKKEILAKFATKGIRKPRRPRIQKVNKILKDTRKLSVFSFEMIDIYLFTVESALNFMHRYNFYSTPLFNIINNSFSEAVVIILDNHMESDYFERCKQILDNARISRDIRNAIKESYSKIYD